MPIASFIFFLFALSIFFLNFFSVGIPMHVPILTTVQNGGINLRENSHIFQKHVLFKALFPR